MTSPNMYTSGEINRVGEFLELRRYVQGTPLLRGALSQIKNDHWLDLAFPNGNNPFFLPYGQPPKRETFIAYDPETDGLHVLNVSTTGGKYCDFEDADMVMLHHTRIGHNGSVDPIDSHVHHRYPNTIPDPTDSRVHLTVLHMSSMAHLTLPPLIYEEGLGVLAFSDINATSERLDAVAASATIKGDVYGWGEINLYPLDAIVPTGPSSVPLGQPYIG